MLWVMPFSYPLMAVIQEISARIGRVTGAGIAANIRRHYPKPILYGMVSLLLVANIFNLGADIGAMGASAKLFLPGPVVGLHSPVRRRVFAPANRRSIHKIRSVSQVANPCALCLHCHRHRRGRA